MNLKDDGKRVVGIAGGGAINFGEDVRFDFKSEDGTVAPFHIAFTSLAKLVTQLQAFGQMASNDRAKRPAGTDLEDIIVSYSVRGVPRLGWTTDGSRLAIQFSTAEGIPVPMSMTPDEAKDLRKRLGDHLMRRPTKGIGRH